MNHLRRSNEFLVLSTTRHAFIMRMVLFGFCTFLVSAAGMAQQEKPQNIANQRPAINFRMPADLDFEDHAGYIKIFNGVDLKGWDGDPELWKVENGAMIGSSTKEMPVGNSYIVYRGSELKDFDLKLEIKIEEGGGSGIQYRSKTGIPWRLPNAHLAKNPDWLLTGPQADIWSPTNTLSTVFTGQFYSENTPLGIIAWRGQVVNSQPGQRPRLVGNIGDRTALGGYMKDNAWNEYLIMARGGTFIHVMNGQLMSVYVDDDPDSSNNQPGFIGIELEGVPARVLVRNVWLKPHPSAAPSPESVAPHATIAGTWKLRVNLNQTEFFDPQMCTLEVDGADLKGSCVNEGGSQNLTGKVNGREVSWKLSSKQGGTLSFTGTADAENKLITGSFDMGDAGILAEFSFTARRSE